MTQQLPTWVEVETAKTRKSRATPKDMFKWKAADKATTAPKPEIPPIPRLHVRVELVGSIEFVLEGDEADRLRELLNSPCTTADDVIEHLDPWSSGAPVRERVTILQDPPRMGNRGYSSWYVTEEGGSVRKALESELGSPFCYTVTSPDPKYVDWNRSPYRVVIPWEPKS